ncbi:ArsR/SmtB family transcription factor [Ferrimonas balearica]|uniref:ArsR/SmtB family transcription factor n=1 Tax=Ferrimonas balearica TaxID=44012 RepID=UPI001C99C52C|nr:metalloregulator ArsR/SmtB family transcription factor [Ferrimonas balearica]MBY5921734.1 metalloregulator ArsR/SmtB family transcription factor [Ferrimonas balearica]MBY5994926.1 metalloregulator ArsR/SmtB family transcription factor [Ferrimonas balearica]
MIGDDLAVKRLSELGHETRLAIFRLLVRGNRQGLSVGEIQSHLDIPGSTLSHHISRLVAAGLVEQIRDGRTLYCKARMESLDELMAFLTAECCTL